MPTTVCLVRKADARRTTRVPITRGLLSRLLGSVTVILTTLALGSAFGDPPSCELCALLPIPKDARKVEEVGHDSTHMRFVLHRRFPDSSYIKEVTAALGKDWQHCGGLDEWYAEEPSVDHLSFPEDVHYRGHNWYNAKTQRILALVLSYRWTVDRHDRVHRNRKQHVEVWEYEVRDGTTSLGVFPCLSPTAARDHPVK